MQPVFSLCRKSSAWCFVLLALKAISNKQKAPHFWKNEGIISFLYDSYTRCLIFCVLLVVYTCCYGVSYIHDFDTWMKLHHIWAKLRFESYFRNLFFFFIGQNARCLGNTIRKRLIYIDAPSQQFPQHQLLWIRDSSLSVCS